MGAGVAEIVLKPGEFAVGAAGTCMRTLLGSCVSIVLWHAGLRVGAMSHFLLAARGRQGRKGLDARYGDEALSLMIAGLARYGVAPTDCEAKIFGGGNMFPDQSHGAAPLNVGRRNGEAARELLREHGIPVASENLFGVGHRQIIFEVATGDVWVRQGALQTGPMPLEPR
ncbi:chemotaxis protein CheD [Piscinibacter sp. HJYY11]|uniref:chemotaxis protein CheD n=1 Tax=Piscinibacter sp. HJYY11 TaxID=2801333 RepID=UPI00191DD853|nr:chemotaxis protein CheD [Piscinibacter sp. HJYY11]MBL0728516.1 chemotaxis protein CheD [Piscinibacter sp. HJYY11]